MGRRRKRSDRLADIETTLAAVVAAANANADDTAARQAEILRAVGGLDERVAGLANAVQVVMAARNAPAAQAAGSAGTSGQKTGKGAP